MPTTPSLTEEVTKELRNEILSGQYREGERLPSQRDLAERFGVNRGCVREALKTLEQMGLADIRKGGARVMPLRDASLDVLGPLLDLGDLPDPELVTQLFGVLEGLIGMAARSAVERGSEQELEKAQELLERFDDPSIDAPRELIELFVEASGNLVLRMVVRGLKTQFMERIQAGVEPPAPAAHVPPVARELARSLARRDPEAAARTMQRLLAVLREHILEGLEAKRAAANGGAVAELA